MHKVSRDRCSFQASMETIRELKEISRRVESEEKIMRELLETSSPTEVGSDEYDELVSTEVMGKVILESSLSKTKELLVWCKERPHQNRLDQLRYQWNLTLLQINVFKKRYKEEKGRH